MKYYVNIIKFEGDPDGIDLKEVFKRLEAISPLIRIINEIVSDVRDEAEG